MIEREEDPSRPLGDVGPYRILESLGQGGVGAVYLAEQSAPVHRLVALKLIKLGMETREVLARAAADARPPIELALELARERVERAGAAP